jgi:hypothetical protein
MATELFSSTSYNAAWSTPSDVWVLLNPDVNQWTEQIDWPLGQLLRRALLRDEVKGASAQDGVLLLAAPEGMPAPRVLVLRKVRAEDSDWLRELAPILTKLKAKSATVFAPREWRPPQPKAVADVSDGDWGIRWVESAG